MTIREAQEKLRDVFDDLEKIRAMCNNPHWTMERRWLIEERARQAQKQISHITQSLSKRTTRDAQTDA